MKSPHYFTDIGAPPGEIKIKANPIKLTRWIATNRLKNVSMFHLHEDGTCWDLRVWYTIRFNKYV